MFKRGKSELDDFEVVLLGQSERLRKLIEECEEDLPDFCCEGRECDISMTTGEPEFIKSPSWNQMVGNSRESVGDGRSIDELFSSEQLVAMDGELAQINDEFLSAHKLDRVDVAIGVISGLLAAMVDTFLIGVPEKTSDGLDAAPLEDYVRSKFNEWFPEKEMEKLANSPAAKVPYDAPYCKGFTTENVEGLWPAMHRLYSLGHDPILGFVIGMGDILNGNMTTIDKLGNVVVQQVERYADRRESTMLEALMKQIVHLRTDVTTSMGLPAPFMGVFNLLQFGDIGEEGLMIAEIVQGMYYEGYDFIHFCSQSIPVMLEEASVRLLYFCKRVREGHSVKESIPFSMDHTKHPKLGTILFLAHAVAASVNAGKVYFTKNPMELNYPEMLVFAAHAVGQTKWTLIEKPELRHAYVMETLDCELDGIISRSIERIESINGNEVLII